MAHPTLEYIRGLRKTMETKKAEIVGENPSTIPGAEHDGKPAPSAKKPDPEVKDQTMVPNSGLTTSGAGDDSKVTHTNDLTAEQAALTPTKKPEVTDDADAKTAEKLAAEIISGVDAWYAAKKAAEGGVDNTKPTAGTPPSAGTGTAESLITDNGKEPAQTQAVAAPTKKPEVTANAQVPATGEGSSGETAAAAKAAEGAAAQAGTAQAAAQPATGKEAAAQPATGKEAAAQPAAQAAAQPATGKEAEAGAAQAAAAEGAAAQPATGKEAEAGKKKAGALDMELTSDVLAKIAAVMLATEEGTQLAQSILAKAAGAEAAEKTMNFLRAQSDLAEKQAEYAAGQQYALSLLQKRAQEAAGGEGAAAANAGDGAGDDAGDDAGITEIADTLDSLVESGEITEDEADQVILEIAQAIAGNGEGAAAGAEAADGVDTAKVAQAFEAAAAEQAAAADPAAAGNAAIDQAVAVDPSQLDPNSLPQEGAGDITADDVADALDSLVESGEITEDEADQLVQEMVGGEGGEGAGEEVSPEQIATALQDAVASGELKPEEVQQVLTELEGVPAPDEGAAAAGAGEGAAAAAPAAGAAAVAPADEAKTAGAKLLAAINAVRAAKAASAAK